MPHPMLFGGLATGDACPDLGLAQFHRGRQNRLAHALFAAQVAVHAAGSVMAFTDGVHHVKSRAAVHIPCHEDTRQAGHHLVIGIDPGLGGPDTSILRQERKVTALTGGPDDDIGRQDVLGAGQLIDQDAAIRVVAVVFCADAFHADDPVILDDDLLEHGRAAHLHAFFLGNPHLPLEAGHLALRLAEDHAAFLRPNAHRRTGAVQCHVPAADDGDPFAGQVRRIPEADLLQESQAEPVIGMILAGDIHLLGDMRAGGDQHGIVWTVQRDCSSASRGCHRSRY